MECGHRPLYPRAPPEIMGSSCGSMMSQCVRPPDALGKTCQGLAERSGTSHRSCSSRELTSFVCTVRATCLSDMPLLLKRAGAARPSSETVLIPEEIAKRRVDPEIQEKVALAAAELCVRHRPAALPLSRHGADARLRSEGRLAATHRAARYLRYFARPRGRLGRGRQRDARGGCGVHLLPRQRHAALAGLGGVQAGCD